jgi:hypothetical protein
MHRGGAARLRHGARTHTHVVLQFPVQLLVIPQRACSCREGRQTFMFTPPHLMDDQCMHFNPPHNGMLSVEFDQWQFEQEWVFKG